MNNPFCEREQSVAAAVRAGMLDADLLAHTAVCPVCSDVLLVTNFLQKDNTALVQELHVTDAAGLWKKAQASARAEAIAKATLPIRIARICAFILVLVAAPRLIIEFSHHATWFPDLGLKQFIDANLLTTLTGTTAIAAAAVIVFLGLSSWIALRQE
jgi:hypothetical protein